MIFKQTFALALIMTHGFISLLSKRFPVKMFQVARAFSTTATISSSGRIVAGNLLNNDNKKKNSANPAVFRLNTQPVSSARFMSSTVEEDLDSALDSILGDVYDSKANGKSNGKKEIVEVHMQGSKPMPNELVEQDDPVDFKDPKFLSTSNPRWTKAGMDQRIIDILSEKGISSFTPVQAEAFDPIMARRDVIGRSRTGTGKTLAFGIPALTRLVKWCEENGKRDERGRMKRGRSVSMIVICPTRELARQVQEEIAQVTKPLGLFVDCFHGGVSYGPQAGNLRQGIDVLVGTPGRIIDHLERGNLNLSTCDIAVLDEADEMLNMGFADDVERILEGVGKDNPQRTQCLMFSATTPPWVKQIGRRYQEDVLAIDSTSEEGGARVAKTVRHTAVQVPPGQEAKSSILEDIIAVEISRDKKLVTVDESDSDDEEEVNLVAKAARAKKKKGNHAIQQKIFGKTIVFVETKRLADELVSGSVFKSLTAQALHGDVGQKQRDATLAAFRKGAFNVLVATDVAARGIDIKDVDLVVQFDPPRDADTYVHRSGRTGRAGQKGVSVLMFNYGQSRDIVRIERDLGHDFKFTLIGPPSTEAALSAAAKTSAMACLGIPDETAAYFKDSAEALLEEGEDPTDIVARCLAAISRRASEVESRSLITGEAGLATIEMKNTSGRNLAPNDVMFTVSKLARMSRDGDSELSFDADVGKIEVNSGDSAIFDLSIEDAKKLVAFSENVDAGGSTFSLLKEKEIERDGFGRSGWNRNGRGGDRRGGGRGGYDDYGRRGGGRQGGMGSYRRNSYGRDNSHTGRSNRYGGGRYGDSNGYQRGGGGGGGSRDGGYYSSGRDGGGSRGRDGYQSRGRGGGGGGYQSRGSGGGGRYENSGSSSQRKFRGSGDASW